MGEPTLSCGAPRGPAYRFLWLRARGRPVAIRIEGRKGAAVLHVVEMDGAGGHAPEKVARRETRKLSPADWQSFSRALAAADPWRMETELPAAGIDGSQWLVEVRDGSKYHIVDRWSPKTGAYRELCLLMLKLAGVATGSGAREGLY
jgi:hypothetical protein